MRSGDSKSIVLSQPAIHWHGTVPMRGTAVSGNYLLGLAPDAIKYVLSHTREGVPLSVLLHAEFRRWMMERCQQREKSELGLSHSEARRYPASK